MHISTLPQRFTSIYAAPLVPALALASLVAAAVVLVLVLAHVHALWPQWYYFTAFAASLSASQRPEFARHVWLEDSFAAPISASSLVVLVLGPRRWRSSPSPFSLWPSRRLLAPPLANRRPEWASHVR
ncbi:hypothetical protein FB451DRAFT_1266114 [Mycena latifolia]|nr:hypothetical protein FB451DRAFT_1266114 [Mycena latifolia]